MQKLMIVSSYTLDPRRDVGPLDSDDVLYTPVVAFPKGDIKLSYKIGVIDTPKYFGMNMNNMSYQLFVLKMVKPFYPTLKPLDEKRFSDSTSGRNKENQPK